VPSLILAAVLFKRSHAERRREIPIRLPRKACSESKVAVPHAAEPLNLLLDTGASASIINPQHGRPPRSEARNAVELCVGVSTTLIVTN